MDLSYDNYIKSAIKELPKTQEDFLQLKKKLSKEFKLPIPTNADIRDRYNHLIENGEIKRNEKFETILRTRGIRTQSGVAVVAVLTKSYPCPGKCIYCPTEKDMPKSYLSNEPAVMRAIDSKFNPYRQVQNRLRSLELNGHQTNKIELIVMGGTFNYLPKAYQKKFITECFRAANDYSDKVHKASKVHKVIKSQDEKLLYEQKKNEKAKHRIVGLTLETRPDYINEKEIISFRQLGCTRVELGVQSIFDDVLKLNKRGHLVSETIRATKLLKNAGFKINYHMMPGLPGSTPKRDFEMFKSLFKGPKFQPDMLKIYPTVVVKNSVLYGIWKKSKKQKNEVIHLPTVVGKCIKDKHLHYIPMTNKQFRDLILKIKNEAIVPYVRIARLVRDVPEISIEAGPKISNLRQIIIPQSKCPCIRCREVGAEYVVKEKIILDRIDYSASDGKEIFLQFVSFDPPRVDKQSSPRVEASKKKLFALLRLRIPACHPELVSGSQKIPDQVRNDKLYKLLPILKNAAIIREVHTYGKLTKLNESSKSSPQHIGLGKKLIQEAEKIAKQEFGLDKIVVISGVGVRGYYRRLGYRLKDTYMVKNI